MEIKQLQYFVAVADEGSFTAAAKKLHMSQPPITTQIKQLENQLGCALFERHVRGVSLTQAGQFFYRRAVDMLSMERVTREQMGENYGQNASVVRLGVVSSVNNEMLMEMMRSFCLQNPRVRFELCEDNTFGLLEKLKTGIVELALIRTPFNREGLSCVDLSTEPMVAVGHAKYFLGQTDTTMAQLADMPLIIYRRWEATLAKLFDSAKLAPTYFCINDSAHATLQLADCGLGVGILPLSGAKNIKNQHTVCKNVIDCGFHTTITAATATGATLTQGAKAFLAHIQGKADQPKAV